ncbi:hypothetical protein Egran_02167 [Elaphomyces granulatus]|uniref:Uncharacterized protein n=1 Tax=Elaphomyces granulatus TaxID=519963 RepID=A0A232M138_9EURO|nr:hypothetical protein Egran_02167 [Elaphomyces granulatus]
MYTMSCPWIPNFISHTIIMLKPSTMMTSYYICFGFFNWDVFLQRLELKAHYAMPWLFEGLILFPNLPFLFSPFLTSFGRVMELLPDPSGSRAFLMEASVSAEKYTSSARNFLPYQPSHSPNLFAAPHRPFPRLHLVLNGFVKGGSFGSPVTPSKAPPSLDLGLGFRGFSTKRSAFDLGSFFKAIPVQKEWRIDFRKGQGHLPDGR